VRRRLRRRKMNVVSSMVTFMPKSSLAPPPDFRYVGLAPGTGARAGVWAGLLGVGAVVGASLYPGMDAPRTFALASAVVLATAAARRVHRLRSAARESCPPTLAIVPWGVLVESEERSRALHWAAIERVKTDTFYGKDLGTPTTRYSLVTIETPHERLVGRVDGSVSLDRLLVHLGAYASEASHDVALDLDGDSSGDGPSEPMCEPLLSAARAWVASGTASGRLDLPALGYRAMGAHAGSARAVDVLRSVLRDRTPRAKDPRPFAAVVAAELHAVPLIDELVELVQSPHPIVAAVAKVAATKLGVAHARVGALDEVEPFLSNRDVEALAEWRESV
jgi:hypothetical protein